MLHLEFLVPPKPNKLSRRSSKPRPIQTTPSILHSSIHLPSSPPRIKPTNTTRRVRFDLPPTPTTPLPPSAAQCPPPATTTREQYRDIPLASISREKQAEAKHTFLPQYTPTPTLPQILTEIKMLESTTSSSTLSPTDKLVIKLVDQLSRTRPLSPPPSPSGSAKGTLFPTGPATPTAATKSLEQQLLRLFTARAGLRYATTQLVTAFVRHGLLAEDVVHFDYDLRELEWEAEGWVRRIMAGEGMKASCRIGGLQPSENTGVDGGLLEKGELDVLAMYDDHVRWLACVLARGGRKVGFRADKVLEVLERFN